MSSSSFTAAPKRRWLTFSLRTFLVVTLALSLVLGYFGRAWLKAYRDSQPPTLRELAQIAKRHGIPMPPKEAKLVQGMYGYINGPVYSPAFLLNEKPDGSVDLLFGSEEKTLHPNDVSAGPLWQAMPTDSSSEQPRWSYARESTFVCAAQLADRGDDENAALVLQLLLERARTQYGAFEFTIDPSDLRFTMARCAYANYARLLQTQPQRWPEVRTGLEALMVEFPKLREGPCGEVYHGLALALDAPPPATGSVEALLIEWSHRDADSDGLRPFDLPTHYEGGDTDPEYLIHAPAREIIQRGFDAVPELIALRGDQRLTAQSNWWEDDHGMPAFRRLGELAGDLLEEMSGFSDFGDSLSVAISDEERDPDAAAWQNWFAAAKAQGEREYLLANLFSDDDELSAPLAYILANKHPDSLFDLVREHFHSTQPRGNVYDLVLPIRNANLSLQQRIELLVALFQKAPPEERESILSALARLDQKRATYFTLQLLDEFPVDVEGEYEDCPEAELAVVVNGLDDERAWRSLLQAARHASVGLRLEILENLGYRNANQRRRAYRLALLGAFLDDEAAGKRTMPGIDGRTTRVRTTVRDLATVTLAWLLGIERHTGRERTPEQWSALRDQVRERLAQEKLPVLE
jgi:hypothetical protein